MSGNIYIIRHGIDSAAIERSKCHSPLESPLSPLGEIQIQDTLKRFISASSPAVVVSSPIRRALESAEIISQTLKFTIIVTPLLSEWTSPLADTKRACNPAEYSRWKSTRAVFPCNCPDYGEPPAIFVSRVETALKCLKELSKNGQSVIAVSHSLVIALMRMMPIKNTSSGDSFENGAAMEIPYSSIWKIQ